MPGSGGTESKSAHPWGNTQPKSAHARNPALPQPPEGRTDTVKTLHSPLALYACAKKLKTKSGLYHEIWTTGDKPGLHFLSDIFKE